LPYRIITLNKRLNLTLDFSAVTVKKSCKKVCIFSPINISRAITLPPALAFDAFGAKSVGRPPDMDQSSFQTVYPGTIGLAIALLSASTVFFVWRALP